MDDLPWKYLYLAARFNCMQPSGSIQPTPKKSRKKLFGIIIGVVLIIIIIAVAASISAAPRHYTLMQSGQVETLSPGYFYYVNFTVPSGASSISITGSYISSGDVNAAVIPSSEFSNVAGNPSAMANGLWYSGDNTGATISVSLSPGSYTLIFYNTNLITTDTFSIVNAITLGYTS